MTGIFGDFGRWATHEGGLYFVAIYFGGFFAGLYGYRVYLEWLLVSQ